MSSKKFSKNLLEPWNFDNPLCNQVGGDMFFPSDLDDPTQLDSNMANVQEARKICNNCDHKIECAEWGIRHERFGIWGGLNSRDLVAIRRKRKIVLETPASIFPDN